MRCRARRRSSCPHPQLGKDFNGRCKGQCAKSCLRHRLHRSLDEKSVDYGSYDDHRRQGSMTKTPGSWSQSPAKQNQKHNRNDRPHGDHAPGGKRRRRYEEKSVDDVWRTGDPKAQDVDRHRQDERTADPAMDTPSALSRKARQISAYQQGLNEQEPEADDARKSGHDVNGIAPCEQRARRCSGERHGKGDRKGSPDDDVPERPHAVGANSVRPVGGRSAPPGWCRSSSASRDAERRFRIHHCHRRGDHAVGQRQGRSVASPGGTPRLRP